MVPRLVVGLGLYLGGILSPRSKWDAYVLDQSGVFCLKIESVIHVLLRDVKGDLGLSRIEVVEEEVGRKLESHWSPLLRQH